VGLSELLIWVGVVLLVILVLSYPAQRRFKKSGKRPSGGAAGAFAVLDEIFHPSSREHRIAMEEQAEARAPMPSPEDKPFGENRIVIKLPPESK
jgi:hypothetical protein